MIRVYHIILQGKKNKLPSFFRVAARSQENALRELAKRFPKEKPIGITSYSILQFLGVLVPGLHKDYSEK